MFWLVVWSGRSDEYGRVCGMVRDCELYAVVMSSDGVGGKVRRGVWRRV